MPDERYALLVNLGKKITDYSVDKDVLGDGGFMKFRNVLFERNPV